MHRASVLVAVLVLGLAGCIFDHMSPQTILTNQVYAFNDETRWARIDLAATRVAPDYRPTFLTSHAAWGTDIQIADTDLTNVTFGEGQERAVSTVAVSWYDQRTLDVRASVLAQHWVRQDTGYVLEREEIVGGDETLLALPEEDAEAPAETPEPAPPTSGGAVATR